MMEHLRCLFLNLKFYILSIIGETTLRFFVSFTTKDYKRLRKGSLWLFFTNLHQQFILKIIS